MRVFYVAEINLALRGGNVRHTVEKLAALARRGHDVTLFVPALGRGSEALPFRVCYVPVVRYRVLALWSFVVMGIACMLWRAWRHGRPEVIVGRLDLYTVGAAVAGWLLRVPVISELHADKITEMRREGVRSLAIHLARACQRFALKGSRRVIVSCERLIDACALDRRISEVILPAAAPLGQARAGQLVPTHVLEFVAHRPILGFVGTLMDQQDVPRLLGVIEELRTDQVAPVGLLILGTGPARKELEAMVAARGLSTCVLFCGAIALPEVPSYLALMDLAVVPRRAEVVGTPIKVFEYMAAGVPVIACSSPDLRLIEEEAVGELVPTEEVTDFAAAIRRLLADPARRTTMRQNGPIAISARHNWNCRAAQFEEVLCAVIGQSV